MTALYVIAALLVLLWLLSLVRVGGWVEYSQAGCIVKVKAGPFSIQVFPGKPKKEKKRTAQNTGKKAEASKPKKMQGGSLQQFKEFLPVVTDAAGQLKRRIQIDDLRLDLLWSDPDPARCAIGFGAVNGLIGMIWPPIEQNFKVKHHQIRTAVDFEQGKPTVYLLAAATLTVGQGVSMALRVGIRFLKVYRRVKPEKTDQKTKNQKISEKEAV